MKFIIFNKKTNSSFIVKNLLSDRFYKLGFFMVLLMAGLYVFQITEMTKTIYAVNDYNNEISKSLEAIYTQEDGYLNDNFFSKVAESDFEKVQNFRYIELSETQIAAR
ncbi:MAG: hypothetical protein BWY34_00437 [Parcubacteria group bacterium ADurb.Bin247]|jgi:hypothetical protein|nr:MAG: hypothetical protein BWY34_00437 [Parcubacteria group bacterium ADurb.Bin247]HQB85175.1 hypothetical protein [Candidatus Pacearchaeota archaeon]